MPDVFPWEEDVIGDGRGEDQDKHDVIAVSEPGMSEPVVNLERDDDENESMNEEKEVEEKKTDENEMQEKETEEKEVEDPADAEVTMKWRLNEDDMKKKKAQVKSAQLMKKQASHKLLDLKTKQGVVVKAKPKKKPEEAYEVEPGEKKEPKTPAGSAGAVAAMACIRKQFPWRQPSNRFDGGLKRNYDDRSGGGVEPKGPPAQKARPGPPKPKARPKGPAVPGPEKRPKTMVPTQPSFPPPPRPPRLPSHLAALPRPPPVPKKEEPAQPAVPGGSSSAVPGGYNTSSGSSSAAIPKGARRCPKGGYYLPNNMGYVDPYGQFHVYLGFYGQLLMCGSCHSYLSTKVSTSCKHCSSSCSTMLIDMQAL